jgi:hypothetical protein
LTCRRSTFSNHICSMINCNWICFLFTFRRRNYFTNILYSDIWISIFLTIRTRFLSSYWNLICFLFTIWFILNWLINWLLFNWSFFVDLILYILMIIMRIILCSGVMLSMILFHKIFEQLLYCIRTFWIQILWFFHVFCL